MEASKVSTSERESVYTDKPQQPDDQAAWNAEVLNATAAKSATDNAAAALAPQTHPDFDGEHCIDCDSVIPAQRLAWGRIYCTSCQSRIEKHGR